MRVPFDGIGRVTFFKNVKFFRIFYIFRNCHFEWLVRNLLAIRCPFNRFPSEVRPFFGYNFSFFSTAHRQIKWGKCRAIEMHNIKFETLISFCMCRAANTTGNHEANGFVCGFCESGILIASVWLRSHKCSLFHLPRKRFQFFPDFFFIKFFVRLKKSLSISKRCFCQHTHKYTKARCIFGICVAFAKPNRFQN